MKNCLHMWSKLCLSLLPPATCWTAPVLVLLSYTLGVCWGEKNWSVGTDTGWPGPRDWLKLCSVDRVCKIHSETVSHCEMQFFWVATVASPETCRKQSPLRQNLWLQKPPGKGGSQLGCPDLLKGQHCLAAPQFRFWPSHWALNSNSSWAQIEIEYNNILGYLGHYAHLIFGSYITVVSVLQASSHEDSHYRYIL